MKILKIAVSILALYGFSAISITVAELLSKDSDKLISDSEGVTNQGMSERLRSSRSSNKFLNYQEEFYEATLTENPVEVWKIVKEVVHEMGKEESLNYFLGLPHGEVRSIGITESLTSISKTDLEKALRLARTLGPIDRHAYTIPNLFKPKDVSDLKRVLTVAFKMPNGHEKDSVVSLISDAAKNFNILELKKKLADGSLREEERMVLSASISKAMMADNPVEAAELVADLSVGFKSAIVTDLMRSWAKEDMEGASLWLFQNNLHETARETAMLALLESGFKNDPENLKWLVEALPAGRVGDIAHTRYAELLYTRSPEEVMAWAVSLPSGVGKTNAMHVYLDGLVNESPLKALSAVEGLSLAEHEIEALRDRTVVEWARRDPKASWEWLQNSSHTTKGNKLELKVVEEWAHRDFKGVIELSKETPHVLGNDIIVQSVVRNYLGEDAAAAANWVISNGLDTPSRIEIVADSWLRQDPLKATEWLLDLSPSKQRDAGLAVAVQNVAEDNVTNARELAGHIGDLALRGEVLQQLNPSN